MNINSFCRILVIVRRNFPLSLIVPPFLLGSAISPSYSAILVVVLSSLSLAKFGPLHYPLSRRLLMQTILFILVGMCLQWSAIPTSIKSQRTLEPLRGRIVSELRYKEKGSVRFGFEVTEPFQAKLWCVSVLLPWRNSANLSVGDVLVVQATVKSLTDLTFGSYGSYLSSGGYSGVCTIKTIAKQAMGQSLLSRLRYELKSLVYSASGRNEATGLVLAMTLGYRDQLSKLTEEGFRRTGLSHVLVLSGFQLSTLYVLLQALLRYCLGRFLVLRRMRYLREAIVVLSLAVVFGLLCLAGWEHSGTRAGAALFFAGCGWLTERPQKMVNLLLVSLLTLNILWPGCLGEIGVQLTYAALLGLLLAREPNNSSWRQVCWACWWTSLATSLVVLVHFGTFTLLGFVCNPILGPVFSLLGTQLGMITISLTYLGCHWPLQYQVLIMGWIKAGVMYVSELEIGYWELQDNSLALVTIITLFSALLVWRLVCCLRLYFRGYGY